jgi:hypothetical protein
VTRREVLPVLRAARVRCARRHPDAVARGGPDRASARCRRCSDPSRDSASWSCRGSPRAPQPLSASRWTESGTAPKNDSKNP